jgi:crossover junction endodeoxyribonuclease RuvC
MSDKPLVIGIDPGLHGAIAVHNGQRIVYLVDMPTVQFSNARIKHRVDGALLAQLLEPYANDCRLAVVERVAARPGEAASGAFCFGFTSGCILGVLGALRVPVTLPMPVTWKRAMKLGKDKNLSRARAIEMFPDMATMLGRIKDHDRAEAILLAAYGVHHH